MKLQSIKKGKRNNLTKFLDKSFKLFKAVIKGSDIDENYIAEEFIKASEEMPFISRLIEMQNVAKINIIIIRINNS